MGKKSKKKKQKQQTDPNSRTVCQNRKARHQYDILDEYVCGIVLKGSEVKSIRNNKVSINEAYARVEENEVWLIGSDVAEYPQATYLNHDPNRKRKLLLHKKEIQKCAEAVQTQGLTLIPLSLFFQRGYVKVKIAIARGRKVHDKRDKIQKQHDQKNMRAAKMRYS